MGLQRVGHDWATFTFVSSRPPNSWVLLRLFSSRLSIKFTLYLSIVSLSSYFNNLYLYLHYKLSTTKKSCHWQIVCCRVHCSVMFLLFQSCFLPEYLLCICCLVKVFSQLFWNICQISWLGNETLDLHSVPNILFHYHVALRVANKNMIFKVFENYLFFPAT